MLCKNKVVKGEYRKFKCQNIIESGDFCINCLKLRVKMNIFNKIKPQCMFIEKGGYFEGFRCDNLTNEGVCSRCREQHELDFDDHYGLIKYFVKNNYLASTKLCLAKYKYNQEQLDLLLDGDSICNEEITLHGSFLPVNTDYQIFIKSRLHRKGDFYHFFHQRFLIKLALEQINIDNNYYLTDLLGKMFNPVSRNLKLDENKKFSFLCNLYPEIDINDKFRGMDPVAREINVAELAEIINCKLVFKTNQTVSNRYLDYAQKRLEGCYYVYGRLDMCNNLYDLDEHDMVYLSSRYIKF